MRRIKLQRISSFKSRLLRALEIVSGFESPSPHSEKCQSDISTEYLYYNLQGNLRDAMLEAEERKAEATLNYQRRNLPC